MKILEHISLGPKTTMHVGGTARYFAELMTKQDVEEAWKFSQEKGVPLVVLGAGSNTIFADGEIQALVVQVRHDQCFVENDRVRVGAGATLAAVILMLADVGLDLSSLTGIPGTVGGAIFGNAGQGPKGTWIDTFVESVTVCIDGEWKVLSKQECDFAYRESAFKSGKWKVESGKLPMHIVWEVTLTVPRKNSKEIKQVIAETMKRRRETQIQARTAGSCFKALPDGTPAWQPIDRAGLRGYRVGGIEISPKHANFLVNPEGRGTYRDAVAVIEYVKRKTGLPLGLEMRFVEEDGRVRE